MWSTSCASASKFHEAPELPTASRAILGAMLHFSRRALSMSTCHRRTRPTESEYLLRDEYVNGRGAQNSRLNNKLAFTDESINQVKQGLKELKDEVKKFKTDANLQFRRISAYSRNNSLRNPTLRINPIASYQPGRGIIEPDVSLYPRTEKDFYSLRTPNFDKLLQRVAEMRQTSSQPVKRHLTAGHNQSFKAGRLYSA
ncbi:hypothetical protein AK830_g4276 [Neonectria ditissima]|uniref:Uncharacterized protein n=1 Tax=Neonectria ditissima TaxID=78410 RepID=A0A0N8H7P0_9HYPO|nr:hypothetical protein AK830_g4276 [Neonectria ditissima]